MSSTFDADAPPASRSRPDSRLAVAALVAAALLFAPLLIPLLSGRIFTIDDLSALHTPLRYLYQSALSSGNSILWTSQLYGGFYLHGEGEVGALHPLHLLLYATLPLTTAINLELIASYAFAFAGMWRFLTRMGLPAAASILGATAFAFSGYTLLHLPHMNAVAVAAHIPWLLVALDLVFAPSTSRWKGVVALALLVGSQGLLGHPQTLWMSALICGIYSLVCVRTALGPFIFATAAATAGLLIAGAQIVPSFAYLGESVRRTVATDFALSYSLHPLNLLQLVSPYLLSTRAYTAPDERYLHEFAVYSGALATVAIAWVLIRRRALPFQSLTLFAVLTSILGVWLALGRYGFVYAWLTELPVIGQFRAPARHLLLVHFGVAVLVAILFEDVRRLCLGAARRDVRLQWIWAPLVVSACVGAAAWWYAPLSAALNGATVERNGIMTGGLILALTTFLIADAASGSRAALMLLPLVFAIDLGVWSYSYILAGGMMTPAELAASAKAPAARRGATVHQPARLYQLNTLVLQDLRLVRPVIGLPPRREMSLATADELRVSGVEWIAGNEGWSRVVDPMPRIRIVPEWKNVEHPTDLTGIDIRRTAFVTADLPPGIGAEATATPVSDEPGSLSIEIVARGRALLATTEAYDPGWRARTDSNGRLQVIPVYGDYLGVVLEPGTYRLSLEFTPDSMKQGASVSGLGLILTALLAWRQRRSSSAPDERDTIGHPHALSSRNCRD